MALHNDVSSNARAFEPLHDPLGIARTVQAHPAVSPSAGMWIAASAGVRSIRLMTIAGIDIQLDWSLLIIFFLIATTLGGGLFPTWHPDWSATMIWTTAGIAAVLFFASVLLHELSHALVGRRVGVDVRRITLFVFGGMAQIEHEPGRWGAELWMAIVGPLTSLLIAFACLAWAGASGRVDAISTAADVRSYLAQLGPIPTLLAWLGQINLVLALFNLVPAFPLDGGRVLRAVMWGVNGDLRRATQWASSIGQAFAWLLIAIGVAMILGFRVPFFGAGAFNGVWLAFIGWFLNNAALVSYRQLITREALEGVPVSRLMLTRFDAVDPELSVASLIEDHALRSGQRAYPVVLEGQLLGIVFLQDLARLETDQRARVRARDVMTPVTEIKALAPQDDALDALKLLGERNVGQAPVIDGGRIAGLIRREDILRWLTFQRSAPARG